MSEWSCDVQCFCDRNSSLYVFCFSQKKKKKRKIFIRILYLYVKKKLRIKWRTSVSEKMALCIPLPSCRFRHRPVRSSLERQELFGRIAPVYDNVTLHSHFLLFLQFFFFFSFFWALFYVFLTKNAVEWLAEFGSASYMEKNDCLMDWVFFIFNIILISLFFIWKLCLFVCLFV